MKLTVLGSGTCLPFPNRGNPGYLAQIDNHLLLLDGGSGALRQVANYGFRYHEIRHILYTHLHPDHTMDFIPFLFAVKNDYSLEGAFDIKVIAPEGFGDYYTRLHQVYGQWTDSDRILLDIQECAAGESVDLGFVRLMTGSTKHTEHSIGYRIEDASGNVLVYSGDTGYSEEFADFALNADLLILECAVPEREEYDKHLTPSEAGKMAALARAETAMFTHFYPIMEQEDIVGTAQQYYQGEIILAQDGMTYEISKNS